MNYIVKLSVLALIALQSMSIQAQVELSTETTKENKKKAKQEKVKAEKDQKTEVFVLGNWSFTSRKLIPNDGFFGDSLGERANEMGLGTWSAGLGLRNSLTDYLKWEGGIAFFQNGEKYAFNSEINDSSYTYTNNSMYIAMPLKLYYTYGKSIRLMVGVGIVPQMFLRHRHEVVYTTALNTRVEEEVKTKIGYSPFAISAVFNAGVNFKVGESWSIFVMPEYKIQLTSSYVENSPYKHFGRSLGLNVGISIQL